MTELNKLFDTIRQKNLNEEFEVGQSAQALFELSKAAKEFSAFIDGKFTQNYKKSHGDFTTEDTSDELRSKFAQLEILVKDVEKYLSGFDTFQNPKSSFRDMHRHHSRFRKGGSWNP